jgi:hypothetical protein
MLNMSSSELGQRAFAAVPYVEPALASRAYRLLPSLQIWRRPITFSLRLPSSLVLSWSCGRPSSVLLLSRQPKHSSCIRTVFYFFFEGPAQSRDVKLRINTQLPAHSSTTISAVIWLVPKRNIEFSIAQVLAGNCVLLNQQQEQTSPFLLAYVNLAMSNLLRR